MPALLTHYFFAKETLDENARVFEDVYRLGNQGPDVFMAYGMVPWHKRTDKKEIAPVGAKMHHTHMVDCYWPMIQYALDSNDRDMLLAYIEGCFAHYCLDRIAHAYIFYRSGFDEHGELHGFYKWSHGFFEALLDKEMMEHKKERIKPSKTLKVDQKRLAAISLMWKSCCPYPLKEESFLLSQRDYVSSMNLIQTRTGWIRPILKRIMGKTSAAYAQAMPGSIKKYRYVDPLNQNKAAWKDPSSGATSHESIDEMFARAKVDLEAFRALLAKAKQGEDIRESLNAWERNLDHDGTPYDQEKKFFDLCWKGKEHEID